METRPDAPPDPQPPTEELHAAAFQLMWALRQDAEKAFAPLGLSPLKALVLGALKQTPHYPKEVAALIEAPPSAVSALLNDLEGRGLLVRRVDPDDRRRVGLTLTDDGERTLDALGDAWRRAMEPRLARLDRGDLAALCRIQRKLLEG